MNRCEDWPASITHGNCQQTVLCFHRRLLCTQQTWLWDRSRLWQCYRLPRSSASLPITEYELLAGTCVKFIPLSPPCCGSRTSPSWGDDLCSEQWTQAREVEMVCIHSSGLVVQEGHFTLFHLLRHHWGWSLIQLCWLLNGQQAKGNNDTHGRSIGSFLLNFKEKVNLFAKYVPDLERTCYRASSHTTNLISLNEIRLFSGEGDHTRRTLTRVLGDQSLTALSATDCHRRVP